MGSIRRASADSWGARLYYRAIGQGPPIIVLHGGPDFERHRLATRDGADRLAGLVPPHLRRLARAREILRRALSWTRSASARRSRTGQRAALLRVGLRCGAGPLVGWSSWLMECAMRHPVRVSQLILVNTAPALAADNLVFRQHLLRTRPPGDVERMRELQRARATKQGISRWRPSTTGSTTGWRYTSPSTSNRSSGGGDVLHRGERARRRGRSRSGWTTKLGGQTATT